MPAPAAVAGQLDREYTLPTIRDFYEEYDFVQVFFVTVTSDGAGQFAAVTYADGETGVLRYGTIQPLTGETWLCVRKQNGNAWMEIAVAG